MVMPKNTIFLKYGNNDTMCNHRTTKIYFFLKNLMGQNSKNGYGNHFFRQKTFISFYGGKP
jgi:hypothetical protein